MSSPITPTHALQFLLLLFSGWVSRHQREVIDYLMEENRVLREQLGGRRLRLNDDQRRRLAVKGKVLGRKVLGQVAGIVTPDTILRWYRLLVAKKYDGSKKRGPGRPRTKEAIADLVVRMATENPTWGYTRLRDARTTSSSSACAPSYRDRADIGCGTMGFSLQRHAFGASSSRRQASRASRPSARQTQARPPTTPQTQTTRPPRLSGRNDARLAASSGPSCCAGPSGSTPYVAPAVPVG